MGTGRRPWQSPSQRASHDFGTNVTLVDADFHTHSVERQYGLEGLVGLAEVLTGDQTLPDVTHDVGIGSSMQVIPAGGAGGDPARLARSMRLTPAMQQMKNGSSHVILDLPATLRSMNAPALLNDVTLSSSWHETVDDQAGARSDAASSPRRQRPRRGR